MKTKPKCTCKLCAKWAPIVKRVRAVLLDIKLRNEFDGLMAEIMDELQDGDVANAQLDGSWPGYAWLPAAIKEHQEPPATNKLTPFSTQLKWCFANTAMPVTTVGTFLGGFACWAMPGTCSSKHCIEARNMIESKTTLTCDRCGGQGWYPSFDGHGNETHQEQCEPCCGTGIIERTK